jgi:hypothetical protein
MATIHEGKVYRAGNESIFPLDFLKRQINSALPPSEPGPFNQTPQDPEPILVIE